ncbi:transposase [uncultured Prevotella sp.]|uniref:transposase n=1 Tax=uncultured Prevotella sp. TaxID=159272 RepID=UPI002588A2B7|nr:transposase [uncultured Prevotella sp.]
MKESCQTRRMFGHNYAIQGTYEVTMAVAGRRPVFGRIVGTTKPGGEAPHLEPSALGKAVLNEEIPKIHRIYPMVDIWQVCLMPDHLHMIVRINAPLPEGKHLGIIIGAFKGGVSRAWWRILDAGGNAAADATATGAGTGAGTATRAGTGAGTATGAGTRTGRTAATVSGALVPGKRPALFEPNYNDHILMRDGQLENWKHYLRDNPRRLLMRREYPDLFQRALCIIIGSTRYSAFGNMLLLRQPEKHLVMFHRKTNGILTELTPVWEKERKRLTTAAESGDVLVTPGISECEKRMKHLAMQQELRLIHIQSEPIGQYWKPERSRFEACASGSLLILAPWAEDMPVFKSDYERFHYLNRLAEEICAIGHTTKVVIQGIGRKHGK